MGKFGITLLVSVLSAVSMTATSGVESIRFRHLGVNEGLSQHDITDIIQDRSGYVWIATYDGLNRYDGKSVEVFRHMSSDSGSLSGNRVICLYEDSQDRIWIGTEGNGINGYSQITGKITRLEVPENYRKVNAIVETGGNRLLAATSNGILMVDPVSMESKPVLESVVYGIGVNEFFPCGDRLFILTDLGICVYENGEYIQDRNLPYGVFVAAAGPENGSVFFAATVSGLYRVSVNGVGRSYKVEKVTLKSPVIIRDLFYDSSTRRLFVATENRGIIIVDVDTLSVYAEIRCGMTELRALPTDYVTSLYIDRQNVLWVGTDEGVAYSYLDALPFRGFAGCLGEPVGFIHAGIDYIYVSVRNLYSRCYSTEPPYGELPASLPKEIKRVEEYGGRKLLAASSGIYVSGTGSRHRYVPYPVAPAHNPDKATGYTSFEQDDFGNLYFSTWDGLVVKKKEGVTDWIEYLSEICHSLAGADIYSLEYESGAECLWIGTVTSGLFRLKLGTEGEPESLKIYNLSGFDENYIPSNSIWAIHAAEDSTLYIGTDAGLLRKCSGSERFIQVDNSDIIDRKILSIIEDHKGDLWMGSSGSLFRYEPATGLSEVYEYKDGLLSSSFSEAASAAPDGRLYFGGAGGITWFLPESICRKDCPPEIILSGLYINGTKVKPGEGVNEKNACADSVINAKSVLKLRYWQNDISFDFSVLPYDSINESDIRYRLNGFDKDWIHVDNPFQQISYKNLKAGTYRLEIESRPAEGSVPAAVRTLQVRMIPAPWFSWWAWMLYVVCALSAIYAGIMELLRQQRLRRQVEIERLKHIQEEEMNDMQLRFFTDITHEFKTPLSLIVGPVNDLVKMGPANERQKFCFGVIYRNVRRMSYMVSQLIDFRKINLDRYNLRVERDDLAALTKRMSGAFAWEARNGRIDFPVNAPESMICWFDPDIIEKILYNLLSNAFHYTPPDGRVRLSLEEDGAVPDVAVIAVEDTGPGISLEQRQHIFERFYHGSDRASSGIGLNMSAMLIRVHHGEISLDGTYLQGSRFVIRFPVGRSSYSDSELDSGKCDAHSSYVGQDQQMLQAMKDDNPAVQMSGKKILLVEDDMDLRDYLSNALKHTFRVETARNGKEALACASKSNPDLILSDVMMPEMDGIEMLKTLKADSSLSHIPVLLLTAKTDIEFQREGLAEGAFDYILKPFDSDVLFRKITNVINQQDVLKQAILKNMGISDVSEKYTSYDSKLIEKLNTLIESRMGESDFNVDMIARELSLSRMSLHRKIKALTGLSMTGYVNVIRIRFARSMFDNGCDRCNDAMTAIGIESTSYFNKLFKEQYGVSPSVYIRQQQDQ